MMNANAKQIKDKAGFGKPAFKKIAKKYHLNFLVLFGSRATGRIHKKSDLDLAYSPKKSLDYRKEYELACDLQRVFGLKTRIDLVNLDNAPPLLAQRIGSQGKLLAEITPHSFAHFQMYAFKLFVEAKPLFNLCDKFITQNL